MKIARAIKAGLIVPGKRTKEKSQPKFYDIWDQTDAPLRPNHIPAPKMKLPDHSESFNPPAEYLLNEEEEKEWLDLDPEDRPTNYMPKKFDALRKVPGYDRFIQERFERCLDLYLCPRAIKQKVDLLT